MLFAIGARPNEYNRIHTHTHIANDDCGRQAGVLCVFPVENDSETKSGKTNLLVTF